MNDNYQMRYAFAGDRDIAVRVLRFMIERGSPPSALLIPDDASHGEELMALLSDGSSGAAADVSDRAAEERAAEERAAEERAASDLRAAAADLQAAADLPVFAGHHPAQWANELALLDLDYVIGIHYPHLIPPEILEIPRVGAVNLHPAYLPFNRGWHTPSWSILEETPAGATLHFMTEGLDAGDIIHQKSLEICPSDTAHTLYLRLKDLEYEVFVEAWPDLLRCRPPRTPQSAEEGTSHRRSDLAEVQRLDLDAPTTAREVLRALRALTTDRESEAAYFEEGPSAYRVRVDITPIDIR